MKLSRRPAPALLLLLGSALGATALGGCGDDSTSGEGGSAATGSTSTGSTSPTTATGSGGASGSTTGQGGDGPSTGTGGEGGGQGGQGGEGGGGTVILGGDRPVEVLVPSSYVEGEPMPLVILLHGYTATGAIQTGYFQMAPLVEELGFLFAAPDGTLDADGENFWNATDACCNFYGSDVDDSAYLRGLVDEASSRLSVDPKRVHFIGHSNGGFMSYRMACDHADAVASIASLAGATWNDENDCQPSEPVAIAQIHGTADATIQFEGGTFFGTYPSALETVETWAAYDGCDAVPTAGEPRDLVNDQAGAESTVSIYGGCAPGGGAELWTIPDGEHVPVLSPTFARQAVTWLLDHPKP